MLNWFRKHATILMVVLGSGAMVIFGLGPVFDAFSNPGSGGRAFENPLVATLDGEEIHRADLNLLRQRHAEASRFINAVVQESSKRKDGNYQPLAPLVTPISDRNRNTSDAQLLDRLLFAAKGKKEGIVVSDLMIENYIGLVSADAGLTDNDLEQINRSVNQTSLFNVREYLKTELLYLHTSQLLLGGQRGMPPNPTESMELHGRVSNQIECEVFPIKVDSLLAKVSPSEPSENEIRDLYEEGKNSFGDGTGFEPGFKVPPKVNVQYLVANRETFLQNEMNKLTDQQVEEEYNRLVAEKSFLVMEPAPLDDNSFKMNDAPPVLPGEGADAGNTEDGPKTPDDVEAPPALGGAENVDPEKQEESDGKQDEKANQGDENQQKSDPEKEKSDPETEKKDGSDQEPTAIVNRQKGQRVRIATQEDEKKDDPQQETVNKTAGPNEGAKQESEGNADETKAASDPQDENSDDGAATSQEGVQSPEAAGVLDQLEMQDEEQQPERKAKPLKDVALLVKRQMATGPAMEAMQAAVAAADETVQVHFNAYLAWEVDPQGDPPEQVDYKKLAAEHNLEPRETGLVDFEEFSEDQLGRMPSQGMIFAGYLFSTLENRELYASEQVPSNFDNQYLMWLTEKEDARIPELDECRADIVEFWKQREARKLAIEEATAVAKKVNDSNGKKLSELYAESAQPTGAFTWFNGGSFQTSISQPFNVSQAGDKFMETAFGLKEMEAGAASNATGDTVYVIQSLTGVRSVSETGEEYINDQLAKFLAMSNDVGGAAAYYNGKTEREIQKQLVEELNFELAE